MHQVSFPDIAFGPLPQDDSSFRVLILLFANDPFYAKMPLARTKEILSAIKNKRNLCRAQNGIVTGSVLWVDVSDEIARKLIKESRMPTILEVQKDEGHAGSGALVLTSIVSQTGDTMLELWRKLVVTHAGRTILFERHSQRGEASKSFSWIDKDGKRNGPNI